MADPIEAHANFHHVTLSVEGVSDMQPFRGEQTITAVVSVKMNKDNATRLLELLAKQIAEHEAGYIMFTLEGRFT